MNPDEYISLTILCQHYEVELNFFRELNEHGFIEVLTMQDTEFLPADKIQDLEKIIRFYNELGMNWEGIEVVLNLLNKVEQLQEEVNNLRNRLRFYEQS